jgi:sugar O-acyltransferase (sialic acid O-acetyltransferase NeuD family)
MTTRRGIIVGGGAFGREVLAWAKEAAATFGDQGILWNAFLDEKHEALAAFPELGLEWVGDPASYAYNANDVLLIAIGDPAAKALLIDRLIASGSELHTLVHPSAVVAASASIGRGVVIGPHSYVATHATLHDGVCVNSLTGIGHDATVGKCSTISSQVDVTGNVVIGERVFIGSGARILPSVSIGDNAKIGAGAVVVRGIKPGKSVYAQPARSI